MLSLEQLEMPGSLIFLTSNSYYFTIERKRKEETMLVNILAIVLLVTALVYGARALWIGVCYLWPYKKFCYRPLRFHPMFPVAKTFLQRSLGFGLIGVGMWMISVRVS